MIAFSERECACAIVPQPTMPMRVVIVASASGLAGLARALLVASGAGRAPLRVALALDPQAGVVDERRRARRPGRRSGRGSGRPRR